MGNIKLFSSKGKKKTVRRAGKRRAGKRRTGAKTVFTIFIILLIGFAALLLSLGFYVKNLDTVYPNVWAEGIKLSGLTLEEARQTLISEGYESNAEGVFATVVFPDDSSFTISGEEVGMSLNANDAATAAYEYGRDGGFFRNEQAYIKSLLNKTELSDLSLTALDEVFIRNVVAEHTKKFNETLIDEQYDINAESIVVVKGTGIKPANEKAVFNLTVATLLRAMEEQTHLTEKYVPDATDAEEVDLELLYGLISSDPISSFYDPNTFSVTDSVAGKGLDLAAAQSLLEGAQLGERIEIPLFTIEPEINREDIESLLFRDVIASKTTNIAGTSNRLNNIVLSSQAINGTILNPGDVFSFNGIVGQRTAAKGYKEANAYVGGKVVLETGGGICQTSSTIYDCVLHTNLQVIERSAHRYTVSYLPLGNDATINWGTIDFKFKNNTDYPIRIEAVVTGRELAVKLIGTKIDDTYIKIETVNISRTSYTTVRVEDPSIPPGQTKVDTSGYNGAVVDTYKNLYDGNDKLISRTLVGRSTYRTQDRVILVPPASAEVPVEQQPDATTTPGPTPSGTTPTDPAPTDPAPTDPAPTDPAPTDPAPTDPAPTDPAPTPTEPVDDTTESSRQQPEG